MFRTLSKRRTHSKTICTTNGPAPYARKSRDRVFSCSPVLAWFSRRGRVVAWDRGATPLSPAVAPSAALIGTPARDRPVDARKDTWSGEHESWGITQARKTLGNPQEGSSRHSQTGLLWLLLFGAFSVSLVEGEEGSAGCYCSESNQPGEARGPGCCEPHRPCATEIAHLYGPLIAPRKRKRLVTANRDDSETKPPYNIIFHAEN